MFSRTTALVALAALLAFLAVTGLLNAGRMDELVND